jgi:hypothetical protein
VISHSLLCSYSYPCTELDGLQALQEFEAPWILRQSVHEGGKVAILKHRSPLPAGKIPGTHLC